MEEVSFKHIIPIQLRATDIDRFGHINNAIYFTFYDLAKTNYIETVYPSVDWEKKAIIVVQINVNFVSQIYQTDQISVETAITSIGTKSFELAQRVIDSQTGEVKCFCTSVMVTFDLVQHSSIPLSDELVNLICNYEGKELRKKQPL